MAKVFICAATSRLNRRVGLPEILAERQRRPARLIPVGNFELAGAVLANLHRILQGVDLYNVIGVVGIEIDRHANSGQDATRADLILATV